MLSQSSLKHSFRNKLIGIYIYGFHSALRSQPFHRFLIPLSRFTPLSTNQRPSLPWYAFTFILYLRSFAFSRFFYHEANNAVGISLLNKPPVDSLVSVSLFPYSIRSQSHLLSSQGAWSPGLWFRFAHQFPSNHAHPSQLYTQLCVSSCVYVGTISFFLVHCCINWPSFSSHVLPSLSLSRYRQEM